MTLFWSIAAAMMALALIFVLPPLFRRSSPSKVNRDELNVALIKQQLAELEVDLSNGKLDTADYNAARKDLEKELLYDVSVTNSGGSKSEKSGRWASIVLVIVIPLAAILLYQYIGTEHLIAAQQESSAMSTQGPQPSIQELVAKLAQRMESDPNNAEGWYMLARSYMAMDRYTDAADAYEKLHQLAGDEAEILVGYADALAMVHEGKLTGKPAALLERALELEPNQPQGLWLAGMAAEQQGNYQDAINHWRQLEPLIQEDPESLKEVRQLIAQAEQRIRIPAKTAETVDSTEITVAAPTPASDETSTATPEVTSAEPSLTVQVDLDPALKQSAIQDDAVFIFAQAVQGPPMPLAVVRKQVKDLPLIVTLDDSMAMMPAMSLSNFPEVKVGARISKSGNAMPQSGDFYGEVSPVKVDETQSVTITIDSQLP